MPHANSMAMRIPVISVAGSNTTPENAIKTMHIIHYGGRGQCWEWEYGGIHGVLSLLMQSTEWLLLSKVSPVSTCTN